MENDAYYFDSYATFDVHEIMLRDDSRTLSYRNAVYNNPSLFCGKVVLDVGCGTGILSLFAAKAGAKKVYAIDNSPIAKYAERIVAENGFADVIDVRQARIEDISIEQVDIIISEWMGYCLLYESMLFSVLFARDKLLKEGGTMFPNRARMFMCGIEGQHLKRKFAFWDDVYGFKMTATKECALTEPVIQTASEADIVTDDSMLVDWDLNTINDAGNLEVNAEFSLTPLETVKCHALVVWFEVVFEGPEAQVVMSTSPFARDTHWAQTIFYLRNPVDLIINLPITGRFLMKPNSRNRRDQDITLSFTYNGTHTVYEYKMR